MAVVAKMYGNALLKALNKEVDWDTDVIKVMLCTSAYTPDQDNHIYVSSVTGEVANGNGYTTGGATLGTKTITYDAPTNKIILNAAPVTWASSTITAKYAVIYDSSGGSAAANVLLGYINFDDTNGTASMSSSNGDFTITWNAGGIFNITAS